MKNCIETLDKKFQWFGKAAVRKHTKGRASGGQLIGVKKTLDASWNQTEWEYGLQLQIKKKNSEDNYILITGYNNKPNNIKLFLKKLDQRMDDLEGHSARLILAGDLNAKIGTGQGVAECSWEKEMDLCLRNSEDKEIRPEGKVLLNWCKARTMLIMNGRTCDVADLQHPKNSN